jgi:hypothetical protein
VMIPSIAFAGETVSFMKLQFKVESKSRESGVSKASGATSAPR